MPTLLQRGATWISSQLQTAAGVSVSYRRGALSVTVTAVPSWSEQTTYDFDGIPTTIRLRRYVLVSSELLVAGNVIEPRDGDRIIETIAGTECQFEVVPQKPNPAAMRTDQGSQMVTVFAARVKA